MLDATADFHAWLKDKRPFEARHKHGWRSVLADFNLAAGKCGTNLEGTVRDEIHQCLTASSGLTLKLDNLSNADFGIYLGASRAAIAGQVDSLRMALTSSRARKAAWRDLVDGCKSEVMSSSRLAERRDLFRDIMEASGYDLKRLSLNLIGVLNNEVLGVRSAQVMVNEVDATQVASRPRPGESAGFTQDQQIALCDKLISFSASAGRHVVWLAFYNAYLVGRLIRSFGSSVTFYDGHVIKEILESDQSAPPVLPSELLGEHGFFSPSYLPGERGTVLARVDLGHDSFSDPVSIAKKQIEAIIALTGLHIGSSSWRLMSGYLHVIDGKIRGAGAFRKEHDSEAIMSSPYTDGTDEALEQIESDFAPHFPIQKPELTELVDAAHAWRGASQQEPLSSIVLHVRILELIASRLHDKPWQEYLDYFLAKGWVRSELRSSISRVLYRGIFDEPPGLSSDQEQHLRHLQLTVFRSKHSGFEVDLKKGFDALPFLFSIFSLHDELGRELVEVARTFSSPAAIAAKRDELMKDWHSIRSRLHRVRNALAHGGPVNARIASTVHEYARKMASWSLQLSLQGELSGKGLQLMHDEYLNKNANWFDYIPRASDAKSALFSP
ncbi:hypothetical protein GCM10010187_66430 [Actinomadura coerulea]|nr:hypothetical protein GCM10010187_66430 [Actinomadura coerulea]